jgi:hypothetical protein
MGLVGVGLIFGSDSHRRRGDYCRCFHGQEGQHRFEAGVIKFQEQAYLNWI